MDQMEIAVRAYTQKAGWTPRKQRERVNDEPSDFTLVLDCETTTDPTQTLRFGFYQLRNGELLIEEGIFVDASTLSVVELDALQNYAATQNLMFHNVREFVDEVLLHVGYALRGTIVGFNLPFDLSRLAISHASARGSMHGGFSFLMSAARTAPRLRIKHLSRLAALIDFAAPGKQLTPRGMRQRGLDVSHHRGFFVDVKTLAAALYARGFSLAALCSQLKTPTQKLETTEHGSALTLEYVEYARADVQATWECFDALRREYATHGLSTPLHRVLSEASIGKAYLKDIGIKPLLKVQPNTPRGLVGKIMCGYFGGRSEVKLRRVIQRVILTDFKSMYPTVNALMGLWRFLIGDGFSTRDATDEIRDLLEPANVEDFLQKETWRRLPVLVRVCADDDLFPVRARYDEKVHTIGLNYLTCGQALWFTLADCLVAKLLTGKTPKVEEAIAFEAGPPQTGLKSIQLFGEPRFTIDPYQHDAFVRLIDLRDEAKAANDPREKQIKIVANATGYGIHIQVDADDTAKPESIDVFDFTGERRCIRSTNVEQPGPFFNPLLGVLITGAARLMLALAERSVLDAGLDWVFCDTDSLAISKPDDVSEVDFQVRVAAVVERFAALNPYTKPGSILQVEDVNYRLDENGSRTDDFAPLFAFAISPKRYALFNIDEERRPVIRKATAHGLGHLLAPYGEDDPPMGFPAPLGSPGKLGVVRWQHDLWCAIITAALNGASDRVSLDYHPALAQPAVSRYRATSPRLLRWLDAYNAGKRYSEQAKPFGFMLSFHRRAAIFDPPRIEVLDASPGRGRPKASQRINPVAPFERDPAIAASRVFDRDTGSAVDAHRLETYAMALAQFHLSPEPKFANAGYADAGLVMRRHIVATGVRLIGKETNRLDDDLPANLLGADVAEFVR